MFLPIAAGQFYLLSNWLTADIWAFPSGFPIPFKNCPEAFQQPLGIFQRLFYTLIAVLSGYPTAFKSISQRLSAKTQQFPSLFSEGPCFCKRLLKSKEHFKILKTTSGSSPGTDIFSNTVFSQSKSHATVPLSLASERSGIVVCLILLVTDQLVSAQLWAQTN